MSPASIVDPDTLPTKPDNQILSSNETQAVKQIIQKTDDKSNPFSGVGGSSTENDLQSRMTDKSPKSSRKGPSKKVGAAMFSKKDREQFEQVMVEISNLKQGMESLVYKQNDIED